MTPAEAAFIAPDFTLDEADGETVTLSDLRGRWVILNFWATWCAPCLEEMPVLQSVADANAETLTVLGINMREAREVVASFADANDLHFPLLINPDDAMLIAYSVIGLPQTFIIAPDGEVVYRSFGALNAAVFGEMLRTLQAG